MVFITTEILSWWQHRGLRLSSSKAKEMSIRLDILKALSFLYAAKNQSVRGVINDLAGSFFTQNKYTTFVLIETSGKNSQIIDVVRLSNKEYSYLSDQKNLISYSDRIDIPDKTLEVHNNLSSLETFLISQIEGSNKPVLVNDLQKISEEKNIALNDREREWQTAIVLPLKELNESLGYLLFFSQINQEPTVSEMNFLTILGGVLTLIKKRAKFDQILSYGDQLKAVNVKW